VVKVHIDVSVFTETEAIGMVSGLIDVAVVPQVGDLIALKFVGPFKASVGEEKLPFVGHLRVTNRIIVADEETPVLVALEDITAATRGEAERLMKMVEQHQQLLTDFWET
jgi:hypothetical protein